MGDAYADGSSGQWYLWQCEYRAEDAATNMTLDAVAADKNGKKAGNTVLKSLFPSAKKLEGRYPYLKKYPFLLPISVDRPYLKIP